MGWARGRWSHACRLSVVCPCALSAATPGVFLNDRAPRAGRGRSCLRFDPLDRMPRDLPRPLRRCLLDLLAEQASGVRVTTSRPAIAMSGAFRPSLELL